MKRTKALVFMRANLSNEHGGNLWVTSLLKSLSRIDDMDLMVVTSGAADAGGFNTQFVNALGLEHKFVPFRPANGSTKSAGAGGLLGDLLDKYFFLFERELRRQMHVDTAVLEIVRSFVPDIIIVNDIWSSMCVPSVFYVGPPCCLITLNDESSFHRVCRLQGGPIGDGLHQMLQRWVRAHCNWIANWRMKRYTNRVFNRCAGIVALTRDDLPARRPAHVVQAVLPPLLTESADVWSYRGSRSVLFVGNIDHFPNRLAVEWICKRFAPEIYLIDDQIRIFIIGTSLEQMPGGEQLPNVIFLGRASKREVALHMTSDDLFIAPIENKFGAKLKLAECASCGMPFLATPAAMSGLPFLTSVPRFDLEDPVAVARLAVAYINAPRALLDLSRSIVDRMRQARVEQDVDWKNFIRNTLAVSRGCAAVQRRVDMQIG